MPHACFILENSSAPRVNRLEKMDLCDDTIEIWMLDMQLSIPFISLTTCRHIL